MTAAKPDPPRRDGGDVIFSSDAILIIDDGPGDTTIRPRPPNVPRYFPGREPPEGDPSSLPVKPPENQPPAPDKP
jgi:hypothetical protein